MKKIILSSGLKGILLAFGSAFFLSLVFIFSRLTRENMSTQLFIFWWFAFGSAWASIILAVQAKKIRSYLKVIAKHWRFLSYIIASEAAAVFLFFYMIKKLNPAVVAFFTSLTPLLVVIIAYFYINEKMKKLELIGGSLSITGVIIITYVSHDLGPGLLVLSVLLIAIYSFNNVLLRKKVQEVPPMVITISRIFCLFLLYGAIVLPGQDFRLPTVYESILLALGSLAGPILNMFCLFSALKYIKAANVALIKNTQPFFVVILSALVLEITITTAQLIGGIFIFAGISILICEKKLIRLLDKCTTARCRKKSPVHLLLFLLLFSCAVPTGKAADTTTLPTPVNKIPVTFQETKLPQVTVTFHPGSVTGQIDQVLDYLKKYGEKDPLTDLDVSPHSADVAATLEFCRDILAEDLEKGRKSRLHDAQFLNKHFRVLRWNSHPAPARPAERLKGRIRLTKYAVFTIEGRKKKDKDFCCALYELPEDEKGMLPEEIEKNKHRLSRFKYSKQMVLAGAYVKGGARPLVWVNKAGLEEALMQGTICVKDEKGRKRYFNVTRSNEVPYDPHLLKPSAQRRYWYFCEVREPKGYGMDMDSMITIYPGVALAGDVSHLGFGRLIALEGRQIRLCILADTGGFFERNLDRLDYFAGVFDNRAQFQEKVKSLPEFANAYILVKRQ